MLSALVAYLTSDFVAELNQLSLSSSSSSMKREKVMREPANGKICPTGIIAIQDVSCNAGSSVRGRDSSLKPASRRLLKGQNSGAEIFMRARSDGHWSLGFPPDGCQKARAAKQKMPAMIVICGCWKEEVAMFSTILKILIRDVESFLDYHAGTR